MKDWRRVLLVAALAVGVVGYSSCSKDKGGAVTEEPNKTVTVTFEDAPDNVLARICTRKRRKERRSRQGTT